MTILTICDYCRQIRLCALIKTVCICSNCRSKAQEAR